MAGTVLSASAASAQGYFQASVSPAQGAVSFVGNTGGRTQVFTVTNTGTLAGSGTVTAGCSGVVTTCSTTTTVVQLGPSQSTTVSVNYSTGTATSGTGSVTLRVEPPGDPIHAGTGSISVTLGPLLVNTDQNNNDNQSMALCEASCFAAVYTQSTVPYYSLDQPRNLTLVYNSDRAILRPFLYADVSLRPGSPTNTKLTLQVKKADGSFITFLNNETLLQFAGNTFNEAVRLGGQFDADAHLMSTTGVYNVSYLVTATYSDNTSEAITVPGTVMVLNERNSLLGRGWGFAGIQRLSTRIGQAWPRE